MPYLKLHTNISVTAEQTAQLLPRLSTCIAKATGKPERYVMIELQDNRAMLFGGSNQPLAYLECKSIGLTSAQAKAISASISELLNTTLQLALERVYIEFSDCSPEFWGWNGSTFG